MKRFRLTLAIALCAALIASASSAVSQQCPQAIDFAGEYSSLNGLLTDDGLHVYRDVSLPDDNPFYYASFDEVRSLIENGTGVLYLGFPECPWCRCLVPALYEAYMASGSQKPIACFNALSMRDIRSLDENGNIVVEREATDEYRLLVELLYDHLGPYKGLDDDSLRRIYFPTTVFVQNGVITDVHLVTLDDQSDPYVPLTDEQHMRLVSQLTAKFDAVW